tara:strand:+ start:1629 stop:2513 length:885 start_codon:yes stop_codon:yes gene_type:complete
MVKNLQNQKGGESTLEFINRKISEFLGITPIFNGIFYLLFIIFSLIVIIELIWKKSGSDIKWYIGYTHFFIKILLFILFIPLIPILINIMLGIFKSFLARKNDGSSLIGGTNGEEFINFGLFKIIINGFKLVLIDSFHTFITFFLVISYFSFVEHTHYFKNFLNVVNFIFFTLIVLYVLTILIKINNPTKQENILGFIILLVLFNFIFNPLFFILTKIIQWGKKSDNFFVNLIILILYSLVGIYINIYRLELNESIQGLNEIFYGILNDVQKFSKSPLVKGFDKSLNDFINIIF